jgi:hypothetical protein
VVVAAFYVVMPETFAKIRINASMELSFVLIFNACSFFRLGDIVSPQGTLSGSSAQIDHGCEESHFP